MRNSLSSGHVSAQGERLLIPNPHTSSVLINRLPLLPFQILIAAGVEFARLPPLLIICLGTTGKVLVRRLQILREQTAQTEDRTLPSLTTSSARSDQPTERFDMSMQPAGPFSWSFMPVPKEGGGAAAAAAGMGSAAMSEKEEALRSEIDLVFTYLCKMGQTWPMASELKKQRPAGYDVRRADDHRLMMMVFLYVL